MISAQLFRKACSDSTWRTPSLAANGMGRPGQQRRRTPQPSCRIAPYTARLPSFKHSPFPACLQDKGQGVVPADKADGLAHWETAGKDPAPPAVGAFRRGARLASRAKQGQPAAGAVGKQRHSCAVDGWAAGMTRWGQRHVGPEQAGCALQLKLAAVRGAQHMLHAQHAQVPHTTRLAAMPPVAPACTALNELAPLS